MSSRHAASPLYSFWVGIRQIGPIAANLWRRFCRNCLPRKSDSVGQWILKIIAVVLSVVLIAASVGVSVYIAAIFRQQKLMQKSRAIWYGNGTQKERFDRLSAENGDFAAWLEISQTTIDAAVFQSEKTDYYRNHNAACRRSSFGALYVSNGNFTTSTNTVIRGRNPRSGSMFAGLELYRQAEYCQRHSDIRVWTQSACTVYRVFAVLVTNTDPTQDDGAAFAFDRTDFVGSSEMQEWMKEACRRSYVNADWIPSSSVRLLTLVTDTDDFAGAKLVIIARQINKTEENTQDSQVFTANAQAYFPKIWYQAHDLKSPWHKE